MLGYKYCFIEKNKLMKCKTCTATITAFNVQCSNGTLSFEDMHDKCCRYAIQRNKECANPLNAVKSLFPNQKTLVN